MRVRLAVRMMSSVSSLFRSTTPESPHFAKNACTTQQALPLPQRLCRAYVLNIYKLLGCSFAFESIVFNSSMLARQKRRIRRFIDHQ